MSQLKNKTTLSLILWLPVFALIAAYFIQYILGHIPCNLCLIERLPYISSIILTLLSLVLKKFEKIIFILLALILIIGIVMVEEAALRLPIRYARRAGRFGSVSRSYLPIKINTAGVMPIIFALSLVFLPSMAGRALINLSQPQLVRLGEWLNFWFQPGGVAYSLVYFILVVLFAFFYTLVVFKPDEVAEQLRKSGAFIPGVRPGEATKQRLNWYLYRVTAIGGVFLALVAILPSISQRLTQISTMTLGGTGILIVISVVLEITRSLENLVQTYQYENL